MFDSDPALKYQSLWHGIAFAMFTVIFIASLLPTENLPDPGGSDKLHHFLSYAVLAWWSTLVFQTNNFNQIIILIIKLILFGGMIEILQGLSGYRFAEWYDMLANSIGVLIGCVIALKLTPSFILKLDAILVRYR